MKEALTHAELQRVLRYVKSTGKFYWRVSRGTAQAGDEAGSLSVEGYIQICLNRHNYRAARLAWFYAHGVWPAAMIDHRDRNKANNSFRNLREADNRKNQLNVGLKATNTSGVTGVYRNRTGFYAQIRRGGRNFHLGCFSTLRAAKAARRAAELQHYESN